MGGGPHTVQSLRKTGQQLHIAQALVRRSAVDAAAWPGAADQSSVAATVQASLPRSGWPLPLMTTLVGRCLGGWARALTTPQENRTELGTNTQRHLPS